MPAAAVAADPRHRVCDGMRAAASMMRAALCMRRHAFFKIRDAGRYPGLTAANGLPPFAFGANA